MELFDGNLKFSEPSHLPESCFLWSQIFAYMVLWFDSLS